MALGAEVAVVLLNYNGLALLKRFLPDTLKHSHPARVYAIDNASNDKSLDYMKAQLGKDFCFALSENLGYAGAYNAALSQIPAQYFVLLNSDVWVPKGWLLPLISFMRAHPRTAACQPKLRHCHPEKNAFEPRFDYAGAAGGYLDLLGYPYCRGRLFFDTEEDKGQYDGPALTCDWASGACLMVRGSAFKEVGGLDERFFMHMEEIDLCWRFHRAGYQVQVCTQSTVAHLGGGSLTPSNPHKTFLNLRNNAFLLALYLPWWSPRRWVRLPLDLLLSFYFLVQGRPKHSLAVLRATLAGLLRHPFGMKKKACPADSHKKQPPSLSPSPSPLPFPKHRRYILLDYFLRKKKRYSQL